MDIADTKTRVRHEYEGLPSKLRSIKKRLNVDSPSFTPASLAVNGNQVKAKSAGISPKFANAAPFKPKIIASRPASTAPSATPSVNSYNPNAPVWTTPASDVHQEFLPESYNGVQSQASGSSLRAHAAAFTPQPVPSAGESKDVESHNKPTTGANIAYGKYPLEDIERLTGGYSTPRVTCPTGPNAQAKRRLGYSDDPSFYNRTAVYGGPVSPSPVPKHYTVGGRLDNRRPVEFAQFQWKPVPQQPRWDGHLGENRSWQPQLNAFYKNPPFQSPARRLFPDQGPSNLHGPNALTYNLRKGEMLRYASQGSFQGDQNGVSTHPTSLDLYTPTAAIPHQNHSVPPAQHNPYSQDTSTMGSGAYYSGGANYPQQLQHHLYAGLPPQREPSQSNQRTVRDLFIPENLRLSLSRKSEASLMTIPNSTLPSAVAHYHSLVPLIHNVQKTNQLFGYTSHAYKATSAQDGNLYCLRRLQGYRLNDTPSEHAVRNIQQNWKRVRNSNVVSVHLAFTNSSFGDSSLIFITDFYPLAETLAQKHFHPSARFTNRFSSAHVPEQTLWAYIVQIANALKAIHAADLAARMLDSTKILLIGEGRVRLNGCAIFDVLRADAHQTLADLQRMDLHLFGKLILTLGSTNNTQQNQARAAEAFSRSYSPRLNEVTKWLLDHNSPTSSGNVDNLLMQIANDVVTVFDSSLHHDDALESALGRELENSRIVRLLMKMNFINERPEYDHDRQWAEHGNRYCIRLFRDYVFHQVDAQGNPVLSLAHVLGCLNRLDAGNEEKVMLTTRDEETVIVVTYRELKSCLEGAWQELNRRAV
ncbi:MAG: hypothetical protein Q9220_000819 [cf. Caloplaca sp. 1 TL-2023]